MIYALAQLTIHDRARYLRYVKRFGAVLEKFKGRVLAADDAPVVMEGTWDRQKVVLLAFETEGSFNAWARSPEYTEISQDRLASTEGPVLMVHGL
jgi:uncharacterized protein (DUF1330 family)